MIYKNCDSYEYKETGINDSAGFAGSGKTKVQELTKMAVTEKEILSAGTKLIKVVKTINTSFAGIIMTTYFNCLLQTTSQLYTASTILFNREVTALILLSAASFSTACLMCCRLFWLTCSGHGLSTSMKKCAHQLERFKLTKKDEDLDELQLLKQDMRYYSESPITPESAFSLSTSTLLGAYGTIVTYLIVLIQFKVSEKPINTPEQEQVANYSISTSNSTRLNNLH